MLLAQLSGLAVVGALVAVRLRWAALVPQAVGGVIAFYALRAMSGYVFDPARAESQIYTGIPVMGGATGEFIFGAEPYLLVLGALLLVIAGVIGLHGQRFGGDGHDAGDGTTSEVTVAE